MIFAMKVFLVVVLGIVPPLFKSRVSGFALPPPSFDIRNHKESSAKPGDACTLHGLPSEDSRKKLHEEKLDADNDGAMSFEEAYYTALREVLDARIISDGSLLSETNIGSKTKDWCMDPFLYCDATTSKCKCAKIELRTYTQDCFGIGVGETILPGESREIQLEEENDGVMNVCVRPEGSLCGMRDTVFGSCKKDHYCAPKYQHGKSLHNCGVCKPQPTNTAPVAPGAGSSQGTRLQNSHQFTQLSYYILFLMLLLLS